MSSVLNNLSDQNMEIVRHMLRRDAQTDLQIAKEVELLLSTQKSKINLPKTDKAKVAVIWRYRQAKEYKAWLKRYLGREFELKRQIVLQKERFEMVSNLVEGGNKGGLSVVSKAVLGRLMVAAQEADIDELKEAVKGRGWVNNLIKAAQAQAKLDMAQAEQKVMEVTEDSQLSEAERRQRLREIFKRDN